MARQKGIGMRRQRALVWAIVLTLILAAQLAALPSRFSIPVASALAQGATEPETGEPTDLAVVALHCAEAPTADALASYFDTGVSPAGCAPAVGAAIDVMEDETALPGSPFQTDVAGSLFVPIGLGSAVEVREDPESLPAGYEPLKGEANGVPYANPVQLDAAVAGAAVLFVNVPSSVAAELAQEAAAPLPDEQTSPADADTTSVDSEPDRTACDLGSPEARHVIVPSPEARTLSAGGAATGSTPVSPASGTTINGATFHIDASGNPRAAAPVAYFGNRDVAIASNPVRMSSGVWSRPSGTRSYDWLWHAERDHGLAYGWRLHDKGFWVWSGAVPGVDTQTVAISSSSVRIGNGVWVLPFERDHAGNWLWSRRIGIDNLSLARSGADTLSVVSNAVHIGDGVWRWPGPVQVSHLAAARSGNGSLAIVASAVRIGTGVWRLPLGHIGQGIWTSPGRARADNWFGSRPIDTGVWALSTAIAPLSSSGALAVSSHAVRIDTGVWRLPPDRVRAEDWFGRGGQAHGEGHSVDPQTIEGNFVAESAPGKLEESSAMDQPAPTSSGEFSVESPAADTVQPPGESAGQQPAKATQLASDSNVAAASDAGVPDADVQPGMTDPAMAPASSETAVAPSGESAEIAPAPVAPAVESSPDAAAQPPADTSAPDPANVAPAVDSGYDAPAVGPSVDPGYVEPVVAPTADQGYVAPEPTSVEPAPVEPSFAQPAADPAFAEPSVVPAPVEPAVEPVYVEQAVAPIVEPADVAPAPVAPAADPGFAEPGVNAGFVAPDPGNGGPGIVGPEPVNVDPSGGPAFGDPGNVAADPGFADPGNAGSGNSAAITAGPAPDVGREEGGGGDE
jgi:hypothetical protein